MTLTSRSPFGVVNPMLERLRSRLATAIAPKEAQPVDVDRLFRMLLHRAPPARTSTELLRAYLRVPEFRAVVSKIADHVASVSWRLYVVRSTGRRARRVRAAFMSNPANRRKQLALHKQDGELEEVTNNPLAYMFDRANPMMSGFSARRVNQIYVDVLGESMTVLTRNALGVPMQMLPMPPSWVTPPELNREYFELRIHGRTIHVAPQDMLWIRDLNPINPYGRGAGVGEALADELDISEYAAGYVKSFFYNSGKPELVIAAKGASEESLKRAKQEMEDHFRGYRRAHRTFWTSGDLTMKELNAKFGDMQVVELKGAIRDTFVNTIGIPPEVLGILTNSNRATIREALRLFATEVIVPRLERQRTEYQFYLAPQFDERLIVDYDDPVPVDTQDQRAAMKAAPWAPTRGEWRESMGLEHRGSIDEVHFVPVNLISQQAEEATALTEPLVIEPGEERSRRMLPAPEQKAGEQVVEDVLEVLRPERLTYELDPVWTQQVDEWGNYVLGDVGAAASFDMLNPLVTEHLRQFSADRIGGLVHNTTRNNLRSTLIEGVRAGEGARDLSARVRDVFGKANKSRSLTIARTEVQRSANFATWAAHKQSGIVKKRQWIHTLDGNTRDEHVALGGKAPIGIDQPFEIDGFAAMYPGGFGTAYLDINCRCTTIPVIDEPKTVDEMTAEWKVFDRRLIPWEMRATDALKRGFNVQKQQVLAAIARVFSNGRSAAIELEMDTTPHGIAFM